MGLLPTSEAAGPGGRFGRRPGGQAEAAGQSQGPAAAAAAEGARLCPTAPAGPGPHGGVVLPPAWLQIAVAAGPGEGERGAVGRGPLPPGRSAGKAAGPGVQRSEEGTKEVAGAGCRRGVPG